MSMSPYVIDNTSPSCYLTEVELGQPFLIKKFLCVKLDTSLPYFKEEPITFSGDQMFLCFCLTTMDFMLVKYYEDVQPLRKISIEIKEV